MIEREISQKILPYVKRSEMIFLNGARQVGKTTLLKYFKKLLEDKKKETMYFNLESPDDLALLNDYSCFIANLDLKIRKNKIYVFIDEIQLHNGPSNFLKFIYDEYKEKIKIFVSGSANFDIKSKIQDSLVGRKVSFWIKPFNFREFLKAKNYKKPVNQKTHQKEILILLEEYMLYGGLPNVVLTVNRDIKTKLLFEYVEGYVNKDIRHLVKEENITKFNNLNIFLSKIISNLKNSSEISKTISLNQITLERYLDILKYTYIYYFLQPYITNEIHRIRKNEKVYIFDFGVRNAILSNFTKIANRDDSGALFENFVFNELIEKYDKNLFYFRNQSDNEIDFVGKDKFGKIHFFEAKYSDLKSDHLGKGLAILITKLKFDQLFVLNKTFDKKTSKKINFLSFAKFLGI